MAILFLLAGSFSGCKKHEAQRLTPPEIHAITRELATAATEASPPGTEIKSVPGTANKSYEDVDRLDITIHLENPSQERAITSRLLQSLGAVAIRHRLTREDSESREGILFFYLQADIRTHAIHVHLTTLASSPGHPPAKQNGARLAIILDDLGSDRAAADAIFALPYPLTISMLPNHAHSMDIAEDAHRRGYQVMLHLPMQSVGNEKPEALELRPGMHVDIISTLLNQVLQSVPNAVGVNNHQGSQATADAALMGELMPVLRERRLFYIDSRTTAATMAYDTAQRDGVRCGFRNVPFLDDVQEVGAIRKQLELAIRGAREKGEAIAIGHAHTATLQALSEVLPKAEAQGVRLVYASDLVH